MSLLQWNRNTQRANKERGIDMLKILKKIFKHKHKWKSIYSSSLYDEGWDYFYICKCGAIKRKYMYCNEEIIEK